MIALSLVDPTQAEAYDRLYAGGFDHSYPDLDLVRLERWYFGGRPGAALDYGCGTGENSLHLLRRGYRVTAVDASKEAVALVRRKVARQPEWRARVHVEPISADAASLPFDDESFDYIACLSVLSELVLRERIELLLSEFLRVLRREGRMIVTVQALGSLYATRGVQVGDNIYEFTGESQTEAPSRLHYIARSEDDLRRLLRGFVVDDIGFSAFKYGGVDEFEYIACARKP